MIKIKPQADIKSIVNVTPFLCSVLSLFLFIAVHIPLFAQLKVVPLPQNHETPSQKTKANAKTQTDPLLLPFWDDFSFTPVNNPSNIFSGFPLDSIWEKSRSTLINSGSGINAPSRNVATLDGVDSVGAPYSTDLLANGFNDRLMSRRINLNLSGGVSLAERNSVYLGFFFQAQGNGEAPDLKDYLVVEFKTNTEVWETVMTIFPKASRSVEQFYDTLVRVEGDRFFHDGFQFRFRNFGRRSGPFDAWNLDYIYLNKGVNPNNFYFPDATIASPLSSLFGEYNAVPIDHFRLVPTFTLPEFDVFNLRFAIDDPGFGRSSYNFETVATFENILDEESGQSVIHQQTLDVAQPISADNVMFPYERERSVMGTLPDPSNNLQFDPAAESTKITIKVKLNSKDNSQPTEMVNFGNLDFRSNDTLSTTFWLKDYYAYDDGSAEYAVVLNQSGDRAAYLFEMLTVEPDTLIGIDIYVPAYAVNANLSGTFLVMSEANGLPNEILYTVRNRAITQRGRNQFQRIPVSLLVPQKFFIGWEQKVGEPLRIGIDFNNDSGNKIFYDTKGTWQPAEALSGSLMIRPVFGKDFITGVGRPREIISAYPNPNDGNFFLSDASHVLEIITVTGQRIGFEQHIDDNQTRVNLLNANPGMYIIKIQEGQHTRSQKIIVR